MGWYHLTHKVTGETQIVSSIENEDMDQWDAVELNEDRSPEPDEKIAGGNIVKRSQAELDEEAEELRLSKLTRKELVAELRSEIASVKMSVMTDLITAGVVSSDTIELGS